MVIARNCRRLYSGKWEWNFVRYIIPIFILSFLGAAVGCSTAFRANSSRPIHVEPLDVMLQTDAASFGLANVGIFPFAAPRYALEAGKELADLFSGELLRTGMFRRLILIPRDVKTHEEAIWWGRHESCDLVIKPEITYLLDGSGGLPTQLQTSIVILDVRSGKPLWSLRQKAYSEPGPDVDLFWTTIPGSPAQRYRLLAGALAEQFSGYLSSSVQNQTRMRKK